MSQYSRETLEHLLKNVRPDQESISALTKWVLPHLEQIHDIVDTWHRVFLVSSPSHKSALIFSANDILQYGMRKEGKQLSRVFASTMERVMQQIFEQDDNYLKHCASKTFKVWKERRVFDEETLKNMDEFVQKGIPKKKKRPSISTPRVLKEPSKALTPKRSKTPTKRSKIQDPAFIERILEELPPVTDSAETQETSKVVQDLNSTVVSAYLMSDQIAKLQVGLENFVRAREEYEERKAEGMVEPFDKSELDESMNADEKILETDAEIIWDKFDTYIYDIDVKKSSQSIQEYRDLLVQVAEKRDAAESHMEKFMDFNACSKAAESKKRSTEEYIRKLEAFLVKVKLADELSQNLQVLKATANIEPPVKRQRLESPINYGYNYEPPRPQYDDGHGYSHGDAYGYGQPNDRRNDYSNTTRHWANQEPVPAKMNENVQYRNEGSGYNSYYSDRAYSPPSRDYGRERGPARNFEAPPRRPEYYDTRDSPRDSRWSQGPYQEYRPYDSQMNPPREQHGGSPSNTSRHYRSTPESQRRSYGSYDRHG